MRKEILSRNELQIFDSQLSIFQKEFRKWKMIDSRRERSELIKEIDRLSSIKERAIRVLMKNSQIFFFRYSYIKRLLLQNGGKKFLMF